MRKKIIVGLVIILLLGGVSWLLAGDFQKAIPTSEQKEVIKVAGLSTIDAVVLQWAKAEGYFDEEGLNVEIKNLVSTEDGMLGLQRGDFDVAIASRSAGTYNNLLKNPKLKIISDMSRTRPVLIVRSDLQDKVKQLSDLKGKTFATPRVGSTSQYTLARILNGSGITIDDLVSQSLKQLEAVAAFQSKSLDAGLVNEPYASIIEAKGIGFRFNVENINKILSQPEQFSLLVANEDVMAQRKAAFKIFFRALQKSAVSYEAIKNGVDNEKRLKVAQLVAVFTQADPEIVLKGNWPSIDLGLRPDVAYLQESFNWYAQRGLIDGALDFAERTDLSLLP